MVRTKSVAVVDGVVDARVAADRGRVDVRARREEQRDHVARRLAVVEVAREVERRAAVVRRRVDARARGDEQGAALPQVALRGGVERRHAAVVRAGRGVDDLVGIRAAGEQALQQPGVGMATFSRTVHLQG